MFAQWLLPCEAKQPELFAPNFFLFFIFIATVRDVDCEE
jgi:hypothetical protein